MIKKIDLEKIINDLAIKQNKIFSKEVQFQFDLAWELKKTFPKYDVVLEYLYKKNKWYIDIVVFSDDEKKCVPIELKYKTTAREIEYKIGNQFYWTYNQGACDEGSYDYIKDIYRIESINEPLKYKGEDYTVESGFAIILTNDWHYYKELPSKKENDKYQCYYWQNFQLAQEKIRGELFWVDPKTKDGKIENPGKHTTKDREQSINIKGPYYLKNNWKDYRLEVKPEFKYLITEISKQEK